jgi:uncharacterized OsmC-like protein
MNGVQIQFYFRNGGTYQYSVLEFEIFSGIDYNPMKLSGSEIMSDIRIDYKGKKRCELVHIASGTTIITDAPVDNFGKGESFSPTDLMSSSLAACMITIMGIQLEPLGVSLEGASCLLKKHMAANPRRISQIDLDLQMPLGIAEKYRSKVEEIARTCPVQFSINPGIKVVLKIRYSD